MLWIFVPVSFLSKSRDSDIFLLSLSLSESEDETARQIEAKNENRKGVSRHVQKFKPTHLLYQLPRRPRLTSSSRMLVLLLSNLAEVSMQS